MPAIRNPSALDVFADRDIRSRNLRVYVARQDGMILMPGTFVEPDLGVDKIPPSLALDMEDGAQALMNELWRLGIRPTDTGSAGQLAATQHHLDDMRKIVFEHFLKGT